MNNVVYRRLLIPGYHSAITSQNLTLSQCMDMGPMSALQNLVPSYLLSEFLTNVVAFSVTATLTCPGTQAPHERKQGGCPQSGW